jgi:hypothetical protein
MTTEVLQQQLLKKAVLSDFSPRYRIKPQLPRRQPGPIVLIGTVHQQRDRPFQRPDGFQQQPPGPHVRDVPNRGCGLQSETSAAYPRFSAKN